MFPFGYLIANSKYPHKVDINVGILETIPANKIIDIPFPTPFWFICSPNHIISAVPAVNVNIITIAENTPSKP